MRKNKVVRMSIRLTENQFCTLLKICPKNVSYSVREAINDYITTKGSNLV